MSTVARPPEDRRRAVTLNGAFAVEEFGHQPAGLPAGGTLQLTEIDERGAGCDVTGGGVHLGIADAGGRFLGRPMR